MRQALETFYVVKGDERVLVEVGTTAETFLADGWVREGEQAPEPEAQPRTTKRTTRRSSRPTDTAL